MNLRLAKEIYDATSIEAAAEAFSGLASISIEDCDTQWLCGFTGCKNDEETTVCEFENYVIDYMNGA